MKMRRPRTLLGMVLLGLAFVTVPLLVAVGNAMIRLGQLANESEVVLGDGAFAALENQRLTNLLERHHLGDRDKQAATRDIVRELIETRGIRLGHHGLDVNVEVVGILRR